MSSFKEWLKSWDEGNFDFTRAAMGPLHPDHKPGDDADSRWKGTLLPGAEKRERSLFLHLYPVAAALLSAVIIVFLLLSVAELPAFGRADTPANNSEVIRRYIESGEEETGAVNVVAGVILDYRAFDTLGESHVLFTATAAVFILMLTAEEAAEKKKERRILENDPILRQTARVLIPVIILFGIYVILCGHLGPGGGFSGGAIIGSALILYSMTFSPKKLQKVLNMKTYRGIVLVSLLFYSFAKCYSFFCGANGLHTIFSAGIPGRIFSAGLILPLNIAVGLVVACTMYGFYSIFTRGRI